MNAPKPPAPPPSDRKARVAEALRANLRRRKAQARGRKRQARGDANGKPAATEPDPGE